MKRIAALSILIVALIGQSLFAQSADLASVNTITEKNDMTQRASMNPFGLIDLSKIKWSNSYSVSYFSAGGNSMSLGVLNTQLTYEFSSKLSMAINLGLAHNTGAIVNGDNADASILPGFSLDYHPSDKFRLGVSVQTYRGFVGSNGMNSGYWWRDPFFPY